MMRLKAEEKEMTLLEQKAEIAILSEQRSPPLYRDIGYLLIKILLVGVIFSVLLLVVFGATRNTDLGMSPAAKHGDLVFYFRFDKQYATSDLVALKLDGAVQIRRVVAIEGDTVDINENGLVINGHVQQEIEIIGETLVYAEGIELPITLGDDELFLLGDNRELSEDSRLYGSVNVSDTLGKVMVIMRRRNF